MRLCTHPASRVVVEDPMHALFPLAPYSWCPECEREADNSERRVLLRAYRFGDPSVQTDIHHFEVVEAAPHVIAHITDRIFYEPSVLQALIQEGYRVELDSVLVDLPMLAEHDWKTWVAADGELAPRAIDLSDFNLGNVY